MAAIVTLYTARWAPPQCHTHAVTTYTHCKSRSRGIVGAYKFHISFFGKIHGKTEFSQVKTLYVNMLLNMYFINIPF